MMVERVFGKPSYCDKCHQMQYPDNCCVCNGRNPEIKKQLDAEAKEIDDMLKAAREKRGCQ